MAAEDRSWFVLDEKEFAALEAMLDEEEPEASPKLRALLTEEPPELDFIDQ